MSTDSGRREFSSNPGLAEEQQYPLFRLDGARNAAFSDAMVETDEQRKLDRLLERLKAKLPDRMARCIAWLVSPSAVLLRLPLGLLLMLGGIFSILPLLGAWMLPVGILLLAVDVPFLRRWVVKIWPKIEARWRLRRSRASKNKAEKREKLSAPSRQGQPAESGGDDFKSTHRLPPET